MPRTDGFARAFAAALRQHWPSIARPSQLPPPDGWSVWMVMAGRGWGKTRTGAEFVRAEVEAGRAKRVALVAPTADDVRQVMTEGPSGILAISPPWDRPLFEPSKRKITWKNGAVAHLYSADEPERLRGPEHDLAWCDEAAVWRYPSAWDTLQLGLRIGAHPRTLVTTTPKHTRLIRDLVKREGDDVRITRGRTSENAANLAKPFLSQVLSRYQGTRLARQELDGELLEDVVGAMWSRDLLDACRVVAAPQLTRVVVAVDPSGGGEDEAGIVVCGLGSDGRGYVLADLSGRMGSTEWARVAVRAYHANSADRIVAEGNFGGDMVEATLRSVDPSVSFKKVIASRGKLVRAEPVAALFEQRRCHIVGSLAQLEDELCSFTAGFDAKSAGFSPGRLDAMVWGFTELMLGASCAGWIEFYQRLSENNGVPVMPEAPPGWRPRYLGDAPPKPAAQQQAPDATGVTMRIPMVSGSVGMELKVGSKRYVAGPDGEFEADPDDVPTLMRMGCARAP